MKKLFVFIVLILMPIMLGMGSLSESDSPEKIPVTKEKFGATFIDQMDVITECTGVSINGKTFIEGTKGNGLYTIAFKEISDIIFVQKAEKLSGMVRLINDERVEMVLKKDHKAYGKTKYGTFQIMLTKLSRMIVNVHPEMDSSKKGQ